MSAVRYNWILGIGMPGSDQGTAGTSLRMLSAWVGGSRGGDRSSSKFLCHSYIEAIRVGSISYAVKLTYAGEENAMLTAALLIGFALVCLVIVYERLNHRL